MNSLRKANAGYLLIALMTAGCMTEVALAQVEAQRAHERIIAILDLAGADLLDGGGIVDGREKLEPPALDGLLAGVGPIDAALEVAVAVAQLHEPAEGFAGLARIEREVIAVDQDSLGKQARIVRHTEDEFILAKPMADGSLAVGLFNLADAAREVSVTWQRLGIEGRRRVRDIWRQQDAGTVTAEYKSVVPPHGVALARLFR